MKKLSQTWTYDTDRDGQFLTRIDEKGNVLYIRQEKGSNPALIVNGRISRNLFETIFEIMSFVHLYDRMGKNYELS